MTSWDNVQERSTLFNGYVCHGGFIFLVGMGRWPWVQPLDRQNEFCFATYELYDLSQSPVCLCCSFFLGEMDTVIDLLSRFAVRNQWSNKKCGNPERVLSKHLLWPGLFLGMPGRYFNNVCCSSYQEYTWPQLSLPQLRPTNSSLPIKTSPNPQGLFQARWHPWDFVLEPMELLILSAPWTIRCEGQGLGYWVARGLLVFIPLFTCPWP
jgi:hypothetical protein